MERKLLSLWKRALVLMKNRLRLREEVIPMLERKLKSMLAIQMETRGESGLKDAAKYLPEYLQQNLIARVILNDVPPVSCPGKSNKMETRGESELKDAAKYLPEYLQQNLIARVILNDVPPVSCPGKSYKTGYVETHERIKFSRDQLLQLRELPFQDVNISNKILKVKQVLESEVFCDDLPLARGDIHVQPPVQKQVSPPVQKPRGSNKNDASQQPSRSRLQPSNSACSSQHSSHPPKPGTFSLVALDGINDNHLEKLYTAVFNDYFPALFLRAAQQNKDLTRLVYDKVTRAFVGFVMCVDQIHHVEIVSIAVLKEFQSVGIGKLLINYVICTCHAKGVKEIAVLALPQAVGFYEKFGFTAIKTVAQHFNNSSESGSDSLNGGMRMIKKL